jgi:hypothetical protein
MQISHSQLDGESILGERETGIRGRSPHSLAVLPSQTLGRSTTEASGGHIIPQD